MEVDNNFLKVTAIPTEIIRIPQMRDTGHLKTDSSGKIFFMLRKHVEWEGWSYRMKCGLNIRKY